MAQNRKEVLFDASIRAETMKGTLIYVYPTYGGGLERWHTTDDFAQMERHNPPIYFEVQATSRVRGL